MGAFTLGIRTVLHDSGKARAAGDTAMRSGLPGDVTSGEAATAGKPAVAATALEAVSAFVPERPSASTSRRTRCFPGKVWGRT